MQRLYILQLRVVAVAVRAHIITHIIMVYRGTEVVEVMQLPSMRMRMLVGVGAERVEMARKHLKVVMQILEALTVALVEKYPD